MNNPPVHLTLTRDDIEVLQAVLQLAIERHYDEFYSDLTHEAHLRLERLMVAKLLPSVREEYGAEFVASFLKIHRPWLVHRV